MARINSTFFCGRHISGISSPLFRVATDHENTRDAMDTVCFISQYPFNQRRLQQGDTGLAAGFYDIRGPVADLYLADVRFFQE
jgi:hypothetical protein